MKKNILWLLALIWSVTAVGETITVARALEICGGLASGASTTESYTIEGYVNMIASNDFNSTYNNMRFWIADTKGSASTNANGALLVYRGRPDVELQVGDKVSVTSTLINYKGTTYETNTTNCPVTLLYRPTVLTERDTTYGSLRVCAQNLENYYIHPNTGRGNYTEAEITEKTQKIVNMMLTVDADIYAFCEVEAKPEVLSQLASAANASVNGNPYVAVSDGIDVDWDATYNNNIKSGFIYRSDRVAPVGSNNAIYSANYYCNTMRYQAFQQLSNGEKLVVSMNHFKAKDSSSDQGESTRLTNANRLVNTLSTVTTDPDILILGDLNCQYGEAPITYIMNAGYAEQILRFDSTNYSHCYGGGELIDHVIANSSMASQIVDAYIRHLSTTCSVGVTSEMSYSDHDPYVVEINLASGQGTSPITTCAAAAEAALSVSANNELYNNGATYTIRGYVTAIQTAYNPTYGNISFWMADTQNGGKVLEAYRCTAEASAVPNVGDYVEVTGNLTKYGSTPEFASGCSCQVIYTSAPPVNLGAKTIYEFLQLKNVKDTCVLTGIVENIVMDSEDTTQYNKFGNFYINDGTGSLYIYGLLTADGQTQQFRTMGIDEGDTLTLKAVYAEFNSKPQAANAIYVSHSKFVSTNWGPVTVKLDPTSVETYNWGNVGIWAWVTNGTNSTDLFASWPGVQVTKDITGWWSYTFENIPEGQLNIIWNDFGSYGYQTADINNITDNTCFKLTGKSYYQVVTCQDTLHLANVANYIDFQALSAAYPAMTATTITSTNTYTLPNGSVLRGWLNPETSAEASNTWNVKENYNTVMPTPEMNGVEALRAGTMFRAASHTSISLGAFNMPTDGKLTVYFQPNGDSNRGVSITVGDNTYDFMKSGVKIDNIRPAYAAEVDLPAGYYMKGSVVITVLSNTINIFGVRISPEPEVVLSNDLTVAEAITLGNQLGNNTLSEDSVSVIGYVVSAQPFDMAFGNQSFYIADAPNGEQTMQAYRAIPMKDGALYPVLVGDLVRIKGKIQHYVNANTSEDFVELYQPSVSFLTEVDGDRSLPDIPVINVTQALQRGNELSVGYRTSTVYDIVGYVTNIVEDAVSTYGNMTFWISDTQNGAASNAEGGFYVYRGATGKSLQVGDQVRVRTYIRNTSVLIDNSNVIASSASVPVTFLCQSMSNVNISKVWPIILDNTTYSAWNGKIQYDFRQNDENCFFYNWENTYSSISSGSGLNFYGNYDGYWRFVVGTQYWAGGGLYLGNNPALTAEALRQAIVAHPEKYYLHMAVKATDNYTHAFYVFDSEAAAFELGDHSAYGHEVRQNFTRNGEWQEIYVPLSDYVNAFAAMDMSNNPNLFVILSEGVQGAQIDLDAVFICEIGENTPQPTDAPTAADLVAAGYNMTNNIVLCFQFDVAPCNDVVVAGTYRMDSLGNWITDPSQLVHMTPLAGFEGWYAAQIPYSEYSVQAKPVQLSDVGAFNWDYQAGDYWIHWGGNEAYIESGYNNEVNVYYESPGAYIYEIPYWKNNNNPCTSHTSTYTVLLSAPQNAPDAIEIIGSFDNWIGTPMTYDAQTGFWTATITATPTDVFKFRQAGTWDNEILVYDAENNAWMALPNMVISQYLYDNIVYVDFDNSEMYRWLKQGAESEKYIPYNLHAVSESGKVVFTWEAEMISDSYALNIYDVADNNRYLGHLSVQGVTSLTYMVEDFLDGKEIRWSLEPQSPYMLDEVFADSTIIMHKSQVELSNFNLSTADGITLDLTWQSNVPVLQYMVEVEMSGSLLRQEIVTTAEFHYTSPIPGVANVYVAPLNAAGETIGRYAYAGAIELSAVPEPFKNLQAVANEHDINATWEGAADSVYLQIFHMVDGEFTDIVYQSVVAGHSFTYTVEEDGNYAVQLRAWEEMNPGEYGIVPYANYVVVQVFTVPTYTIQIDATEGGYIFPSGLSGNYPVGYTLNAYAYPYEGYRFVRWSDGVAEAERTINVQGAMSVTAQFEALAVYNVAVQAAEGGWIYVQGEMDVFDTSYMSEKYEDTQLTIYASAAQGYSFYQWSDGETSAQRTVTVNSNITLTAIFMPNRHLTLAVNDIAMGGISVAGEYSYADGVYTTAHNASLTLTAQPNQGYRFVNWSDGVQTVQRVVTMTEDKTLTAFFELITTPVVQYTITVSAGVGGMVNNASGTYNAGDQIELKATPMEGYEFVQWSDGVSTNPRTLTVTGNKSLIAIFRIRTISISVTAEAGGTVNGTVSGAYDYGTSVSFSAVPAEHYRFTGWSDGNTDRVRYITLVKDTVITASFVAIPLYTLTLTAGEGGQIRVDNDPYTTTFNRVYEENTSVVIEAAANANYVFSRWSDGNTNAIRVVPMNSDLTLTAEFLPLCTLTIIANNGSVRIEGNAEATANNVYKAAYGTVLTLTAQPAEGYRFVKWSDEVQTISREITLTSNLFLEANFELASTTPQYTVTIGITGTGTGTVNGVTSISARYYENDQLPLTAEAGESSEFAGWSDGVTTASRTLVVSSDTVIIAIFNLVQTPKQYTVTFKNYDGTVLESKLWNEGETPVCSVTPTRADDDANTYSFVGWTPEIVPVAADAVYTAVFEATPITPTTYTVTFYDWDDTILSTQTVNKGENATPPATPTRQGYVFTGWDGNYTNVQQDESVFATYKPAEEALDNVLDGNTAVKIFREGQILIIRGDKTYTLTGQELK